MSVVAVSDFQLVSVSACAILLLYYYDYNGYFLERSGRGGSLAQCNVSDHFLHVASCRFVRLTGYSFLLVLAPEKATTFNSKKENDMLLKCRL